MGSILVVNAGSTGVKLSVVDRDGRREPVESLSVAPSDVAAVAHRVVHGGSRFRRPVVIDKDVERELEELAELAPLHNAPALVGFHTARAALPSLPHVGVFDTAFHATLPPEAANYAVPRQWREEWGIRRFGFHGLSVQWAAERVPVPRLVVCHLGGGCSVTAVRDGRSADTTMGFSPLEGVPMATRSGSIDAEVVLHLLRRKKIALENLDASLERASGLLGLSGVSSRVEELEGSDQPQARAALELFSYRIATAVGAMAVALGGLDAIVFTAGVGEGSSRVRADVCGRLGFLGVELDAELNRDAVPDAEIATRGTVPVIVLHACEDVIAAAAARGLLGLGAQSPVEPFPLRRPGGRSDGSIAASGRAHE